MQCAVSAVITFFVSILSCSSFNIEERSPIIKVHEEGSYFGFSVALHKVWENSKDIRDNWLLVGAPLGQNKQPGVKKSGALFRCPITSYDDDCEQVPTDGYRTGDYEDETSSELLPPGEDELKEGQWLGVNVRSQKPGGKIMVCAHRYIFIPKSKNDHYGHGLCYVLGNNFTFEFPMQPCFGKPSDKLHLTYGLCQAGTSLAISYDGMALMGAPGSFIWRGSVFGKSIQATVLSGDNNLYQTPLNYNPEPLDKYSYLGMSVTTGYFFGKQMSYASGAPRSHWSGEVFFFTKQRGTTELHLQKIIRGEQFGSSFGYEIMAADINKDGYDDLLVAAPFYFDDDHNRGGAVHIYYNLRNCGDENCRNDTVLYGKSESRFGIAMTALGDINKDGYTDIAIGAPYEGEGAVYIYLGSKNGLQLEPSQVIKYHGIKTLGYSLSGGLDMDNNKYPDLLVGAYETDAVVLYTTRPIIDINIQIVGDELKNINASKKGCSTDPNSHLTCFSFRSCFSIMEEFPSFEVKYHIKEKVAEKKIARIWLKNDRIAEHRHERTLYLNVTESQTSYCQYETAYINEGNRDIVTPITFQVTYTLTNNQIMSPILNKTSLKQFEATFQKDCGEDDICESKLILRAGTLFRSTPEGYIVDFEEQKGEGYEKFQFLLDANITNQGESAYEAKLFVNHPTSLSFVGLYHKPKNVDCASDENSNKTLVVCELGNPLPAGKRLPLRLKFEIVRNTTDELLKLYLFVNSTSKELSTRTSSNVTAILRKVAQYSIVGNSKTPNLFYGGEIKGESAMKYLEDIGSIVLHKYVVSNRGQWALQEVTVTIAWPFQLQASGPEGKWLLYLENATIVNGNIVNECTVSPRNAVNRLHLPYRQKTSISITSRNSTRRVEESEDGHREKRDAEPEIERSAEPDAGLSTNIDPDEVITPAELRSKDGKPKNIVYLDCYRGTTKCAYITCKMKRINENDQAVIDVYSRIWNSTLVEDYSNVDWVSIKSYANISIGDGSLIISNTSISAAMAETIAYPGIILADTNVNVWIIVGAVLAGLIVLIILILILYKMGFFKRNRPNTTESVTVTKQDESKSLLEGK